MTEEDWQIALTEPEVPMFYIPTPRRDVVAQDGAKITVGDNEFTLYNTPGHTTGVLSISYTAYDGDSQHKVMALGGVGLNFSGVERTETYIDSYLRLQSIQDDIEVSLPNHAAMGRVFERRDELKQRKINGFHPFVDPEGYRADLATFISNARRKLEQERNGTAEDPSAALLRAISDAPTAEPAAQ